MNRSLDLNRFYIILDDLRSRVGGERLLCDCNGGGGWPKRGVYFFLENGETRDDGTTLRVTRVGTHAISRNAKTTLWNRLHSHRGNSDGTGNHRGSIFRKRIGEALLQVTQYPDEIHQTWGAGNSAFEAVRRAESALEQEVSRYIGKMPFLWLEVGDVPGPTSQRAYIERNCISLLSNFGKHSVDRPSPNWLGNRSPEVTIWQSGLWNTNHVEEQYTPDFLDVLADLVTKTKQRDATQRPSGGILRADGKTQEQGFARIPTLIRQLYGVVAELEKEFGDRKFTPDGHLVGSIGEVIAAYAFGLTLFPASNEIHDAQAADGTPVQIKLTGGTKGISLYSEPVHLLVLQMTGETFRTIYNGPGGPAWESCGAVQKNGQRTISLSSLQRLDSAADRKLPQLHEFPLL